MNSATEEKMKRIDELAKEDEVYRYMLDECATLEEEFDMIVSKLSLKRRGQIWDFVMHCEDMSQRKLQIACRNMAFIDKKK